MIIYSMVKPPLRRLHLKSEAAAGCTSLGHRPLPGVSSDKRLMLRRGRKKTFMRPWWERCGPTCRVESAWFQLLKLTYDEVLSSLAFNLNLRPY
jgi:hypothetical protein